MFHQGKSLGEGVSRSSPQTSHRTGSSDSRLLQSPIRGPEGLWVLAIHHRPVYPEHIHRVTTLPYGDSSIRPTLHSQGRLDDLIGSSGCLPSGSNPPGIASVSSLHHGRSSVPVQGTVLRANNCPSGLYKAHGSNIRHSPSLRYQDPPIPRRLVDSSRIQDHLYSSEGQAPASVRGAETTSESRKVITGPISGHDLSRNADLISLVHCETNRDKGSEPPQYNRGVSLVPEPPSSSLATSSGPPFVPYPSGEGGDAKNAITPASSQVQVELSRRLPSHSLGSSVPGGSSMVVPSDPTTGGVDLSLPVPDLSFYSDASDVGWGAIIGEQQVSGVWTPSQKQLSINLSEMMAVQNGLLRFSQFLRGKTIALFCDNVTTVAYLRRSGDTRSQVLFLKAREILLWIESMQVTILPQFIQGSLNTRADLLHQWPAIIDLFVTSLTARLPVFFAPAWEPKATGVDGFLQPWDNLQAYAFPPIAIIRRVLLKPRASHHCDLTLIAPFWPQREWFPDLLELLSDIPIELPKRREICCDNRISIGFTKISKCFV